jgi:FdhE protein
MSRVTAPASRGLDSPEGILQALIHSMGAHPVALPPGTPDPAAAAARLASGIPALAGEPLLAWPRLVRSAGATARALIGSPAGEAALAVARWLERDCGRLDRDALVALALAGTWEPVRRLARRGGVDPDVACTVLDCAARPALRAGAAAVASIPELAEWNRPTCPSCGAPPTIGVVLGKERERRLCCGRCGTGWAYPRVRCSSCGERDHRRLGTLHGAGEGEYRRVEICESCRGYLKTVAVLDMPDVDRVLELDLETAGLDFVALERGYRRVAADE